MGRASTQHPGLKSSSRILYSVVLLTLAFTLACKGIEDGASTTPSTQAKEITSTMTSTESNGTIALSIPVTITFSEEVIGLDEADFNVTNGSVKNLQGSGKDYTIDLSGVDWGTVTMTLPANSVSPENVVQGVDVTVPAQTFTITYGSALSDVFAVEVSTDGQYSFYLNDDSSFGSICMFSPSDSFAEKNCTMDVNEGDIYFWGFNVNFQASPEMCKYVAYQAPWHYNWEVGFGPTTIELVTDEVTPANNECTVDGTPSGNNCTNVAIAGFEEVVNIDLDDQTATCVYDHSQGGASETSPNCCMGTYTLTTRKVTAEGTEVSSSIRSWGGKWDECLAGPAMSNAWPKKADEFPFRNIIYNTSLGRVNETFKVDGGIQVFNQNTNYGTATFYTSGAAGPPTDHSHRGFVQTRVTSLPYAIDPVDDRLGSVMPVGTDHFKFDCWDEAFETKYRIVLKVREWNSYFDWLTYGSQNGSLTTPVAISPDVNGLEDSSGTPCSYFTSGANCNDLSDWDNFLTLGGYADHLGPITNRFFWFPREVEP